MFVYIFARMFNEQRKLFYFIFCVLLHDWSTSLLLSFVDLTLLVHIGSCKGSKHNFFFGGDVCNMMDDTDLQI